MMGRPITFLVSRSIASLYTQCPRAYDSKGSKARRLGDAELGDWIWLQGTERSLTVSDSSS
jgi:hypothetical protein